MKLSEWARKNGLSYQTAHSLFKAGKLPCQAIQLETGTILVTENVLQNKENFKTYIYCRVSSHNKKDDLNRQAEKCLEFCKSSGFPVEKVIKEIASGMNDKRPKLLSILNKEPKRIIVEHKDRLSKFSFNYFDHILPLIGYEIIVINRDQQDEQDLMKDLVAVITSFCCRLYGLRKGNSKSKQVKEILQDKNDPIL